MRVKHGLSESGVYAGVIFLLWPFLSLFFSFMNYKEPWAKNIVWFFVAFFGYTMVISNTEIDANRLVEGFYYFHNNVNSFADLLTILINEPDFFMPFFNYYVSRVIDDIRVYLFLLALIFGYFYSRNIFFILDKKKGSFKTLALFLFILFIFVVPFWNINGFRFWSATNLFVFGAYRYFFSKNKKYLIWSLLSVLVHFSFILPIAILAIYIILGKRVKLYYTFYFVSFFFLQISPEAVNSSVGLFYLPKNVETEISVYSSEEYVESKKKLGKGAMSWYVTIGPVTAKYVVFILLSIVFFKYRNYVKNENLMSLFCFSLLLLGAGILFSSVPSGARFIAVAYLFVFAFLFLIIQNQNIRISSLIKSFSIFSIVLYVALVLRVGLETIGVSTLISNPLFAYIGNIDVAIIELIK